MRSKLVGRTLGDFRLEELIGQGAMGKVYRATQISLGRPVAVKVLEVGLFTLEEWKERFVREVEFLARLEHPNIIPVYATGQESELLYFAMRLVSGPTLADRMMGGIGLSDSLLILADVCSALSYAHAQGIIHRDVKPANVLLADGAALLTDFGLARMLEATTITGSGALLGTPRYLAPEQARREKATPASDLYPVGVILYEIATGRHPFVPDGPERPRKEEILRRVAEGAFFPPREARADLPDALDEFLRRVLARDPGERPGSAADLRARLVALRALPEVAGLAPADPPPPGASAEAPTPPAPGGIPDASAPMAPAAAEVPSRPPRSSPPEAPGVAAIESTTPTAGGVVDPPTQRIATDSSGVASAPRDATAHEGSEARPFGKFRLLHPLGRGGMGVVYKAVQTDLDRIVALKVLRDADADDPRALARFEAEARAAARLRHPGIVPIHEVGEIEGRRYFTMDWIDGEDLDSALRGDSLAPNRALEILHDVSRAVHHAHEQGIIHRDLKPGNILLDRSGRVLVGDFGIARDVKVDRARLSVSGEIFGTPGYMAPEQARGESRSIGPRTDVYALGAVLYHMVTGKPPFSGEAALDVLLAAMVGEPAPPRSVNPRVHADVETICLKAMALEPERRYGSAAELADDCGRFLRGEPILARPPGIPYRIGKALARNRGVAAAATAGVAVVCALLAWLVPSLQAKQRELAVREALKPVEDAIQDARPYLYIPGTDVFEKLRAVTESIRRLETMAADPLQGESAEVWALLGKGWQFVGEDARAETAYLRAEGIDPHHPGVRPGLARLYLERTLLALFHGRRDTQAEKRERSRRWRAEAARRLPAADVEGSGADDLEAMALEAARAFAEGRMGEAERACDEGLARFGDRLGVEEFWNVKALLRSGAERQQAIEQALLRRPHYAWGRFVRGMLHQEARRWNEAREDFDAVLRLRPTFVSALLQRGMLRQHTGDIEGARADYAEAARLEPTSADARNNLASALRQMGDEAAAWAELEEAIRLDPGYARPWLQRGEIRLARGEVEAALAEYVEGARRDPQDPQPLLALGNARKARGDLPAAEGDFLEALERDPDCVAAWIALAQCRLDRNDVDAAQASAERAVAADPGDPVARTIRAWVRRARGDRAGAMTDLDEAVRLDPRDASVRVRRAILRREAGDATARDDAEEAVRLDPGHVDARIQRGWFRFRAGEWDAARDDFDAAIGLEPGRAEAWRLRGDVRQKQRDLAGARADYDEAIRLEPVAVKAWLRRSEIRAAQGDADGARTDVEEAVRRDPDHADARVARGSLLRAQGNTEGAEAEYARALEIDPRSAAARIKRAQLRMDRGDLLGAWQEAEAAVAAGPEDAAALGLRGWLRRLRGDPSGALQDLENAVERAPRDLERRIERAVLRFESGNREGALSDLALAIELDPEGIPARLERARQHLAAGNRDDALADAEAVLRASPDSLQGRRIRAEVRLLGEDHAGALQDLDAILGREPRDARALYKRALTRHHLGDPAGALADLAASIAADPNVEHPYVTRGILLEARGDREAALQDYSAAIRLGTRDPVVYVRRGNLRSTRGERAGQIADYETALEIARPDWPERAAVEAALKSLRGR